MKTKMERYHFKR